MKIFKDYVPALLLYRGKLQGGEIFLLDAEYVFSQSWPWKILMHCTNINFETQRIRLNSQTLYCVIQTEF